MPKPGDVVLTQMQFADSFEVKTRPALVLFKEFDNIVVAGVTSNRSMKGIPLNKKEGAVLDSVIKLNYIFTISSLMIQKTLFSLTDEKRKIVHKNLVEKLDVLS